MTGNIYLDLTNEFNEGRLRAILSSGQAVVVHGLALASKDGDWIVREDAESLGHVLEVLRRHGARYRLGAPLDEKWMKGGWSAHLEFVCQNTRVRTDFVARPPRITKADLELLWQEQENGAHGKWPVPTVDLRRLAHLKATQRERDYAFIGEIARKMSSVSDQLLWSRSALVLLALAAQFPDEIQELVPQRPLLSQIQAGREALEVALDAERRQLIKIDRERLAMYSEAAQKWTQNWTNLEKQIALLPLSAAHEIVVKAAHSLLPQEPNHESDV